MQYKNHTKPDKNAVVLFIDMNSFFASCEQQANPVLRGKPIVVCGNMRNGVIIAPSIEAKTFGIKTGMRLNEARVLCPEVLPVAPKSYLYREYHKGIMALLRTYSEDVIPRSIDEAVVNLTEYKYIYPDKVKLAQQIKKEINNQVGDWLKCSIGIAPNTFLAKLATNLQKPDGLVQINEDNIDDILSKLQLTDLPGIAERNASRLRRAGIRTPLDMRHSSPEVLKKIMGGVVGYYWHYRLNFSEVDFYSNGYKSMSAMRTLSGAQRQDQQVLQDIFLSLCMKLENRLVKHHFFCAAISFQSTYRNGAKWDTHLRLQKPLQDGTDLYKYLSLRIKDAETAGKRPIFSSDLRSIGVMVNDFIPDSHVQYELFDDNLRRDKLRRTVYDIKGQFGSSKIIKAVELRDTEVVQDIIGFGSVKDMYPE